LHAKWELNASGANKVQLTKQTWVPVSAQAGEPKDHERFLNDAKKSVSDYTE
jgi:hypothetical protein